MTENASKDLRDRAIWNANSLVEQDRDELATQLALDPSTPAANHNPNHVPTPVRRGVGIARRVARRSH